MTSHSWKVDLNEDGSVQFDPQMKSSDTDTIDSEDADMAEHNYKYWDHDY